MVHVHFSSLQNFWIWRRRSHPSRSNAVIGYVAFKFR